MTTTGPALRFVDADGHVLEPPTGLQEHAPAGYRDRVWHVERDGGAEWVVAEGHRSPANTFSLAGVAGYSDADKQAALEGRFTYSEVSRRGWDAKERVACMDADRIDVSVLYPTQMLAIQAHPDVDYAVASCRAYNDWLAAHCGAAPDRVYGVAVLPQQSIEASAAELRRVATLPGIVGGFLRPNPTADWKPFSDPVYDPVWTAAADTDLALGFHPYLDALLPGAARGLRIGMLRMQTPLRAHMPDEVGSAIPGMGSGIDNMAFAQAIANPVDMMTALTFITMGGVCERFPAVRFVFLEANGGWIVPWLERLDHHAHEFPWDMPGLTLEPSEYFRRQCWISFDPDESALPLAATSERCGADRIVWASDFPHPDAKYPGVTEALTEAMAPLSADAQRLIAGDNALRLYGLSA
jgi:predicted TIM-barrel fold metal-dependent hydrolase